MSLSFAALHATSWTTSLRSTEWKEWAGAASFWLQSFTVQSAEQDRNAGAQKGEQRMR